MSENLTMKMKRINDNTTIDIKFLDALEAKNEFSGFDRHDSVPIIRRLIKELRGWLAGAGPYADPKDPRNKSWQE